MAITRRRMMMNQTKNFEPDPDIPDAWKAIETIPEPWSEIIYHAKVVGDYKTRYKIGDIKVANFGDEGLTAMHLVGFDCDELESGGYAKMSWVPEHCLKTTAQWEDSETTGGYNSSKLKNHVDGLISKLPKALQDNIVTVKKTCRLYRKYDQTVNLKLWPPSYREIFGLVSRISEESGPIFTNPPTTPRVTGDTPSGGTKQSWSRSASYKTLDKAYCIDNGGAEQESVNIYCGVLAGFSI